jgi:hypothetical protein
MDCRGGLCGREPAADRHGDRYRSP